MLHKPTEYIMSLQGQAQGELQGQAQAQAELQAQLQGQGQGQGQGQLQGQAQFALNINESENKSENENDNKNENSNENKNEIENKLDNAVDNKLDNDVDNKLDNSVENKVENSVENKVETKVDVDVDVDVNLDLTDFVSEDNDAIDIEEIKYSDGTLISADDVEQKIEGNGNQFNIDQVNNLVDNDYLKDVKFDAGDYNDVKVDGKVEGGDAKIDDVSVGRIDGDSNAFGDLATATADGVQSVEAFTQNIVMGANIQFNTIDNIQASVEGVDGIDAS